MEEEVRHILGDAVRDEADITSAALGSRIAARFAGVGLSDDDIPEIRGESARPASLDL
jgi:hypothetical protein